MPDNKSDLPPIPRPLTRGSVPPDFKVFVEEGGYGHLKIKPGPQEILEEHPDNKVNKGRSRDKSAGNRSQSSASSNIKAKFADLPDIETDPDSDYDTDLEGELDCSRREITHYATSSENEHLYSEYKSQCKRYKVVPCSSLLNRGGLELTHINLSNRSLGPKPIVALAAALTNNAKVTSLDISGNSIGVAGAQSAFEMLKDNYFINNLNLSNNQIIPSVFDSLIQSLRENTNTLLHLQLRNCGLNDACLEKLCIVLHEGQLKSLDISENEFGFDSRVAEMFKIELEDNATLSELNLAFSQFTSTNILLVFEGLSQNIFISKLNLASNGLGGNEKISKSLEVFMQTNEVVENLNLSYNNFQDACGQVESIANGLKSNKVVKIVDLSGNSIHAHDNPEATGTLPKVEPAVPNHISPKIQRGILKILEALVDHSETSLIELIFDKISVGLEFQNFVGENAELFGLDGKIKIVTGEAASKPKPKAPPKIDPMTKINIWLSENGLTLNTFFVKLDDDDSMTLSYDEFRKGCRDYGVPLGDDEITELIAMLDLDGDGDINYA